MFISTSQKLSTFTYVYTVSRGDWLRNPANIKVENNEGGKGGV